MSVSGRSGTDARLLHLLVPYRGQLALAALCSGLAAAGVGAYTFLAGPAVRALVRGERLVSIELLEGWVPESLIAWADAFVLGALPLFLVLAALAKALGTTGANVLLPGAIAGAAADLRGALFDRVLRGDPAFFAGRPTAELVSRIGTDVAAAESQGLLVATALLRDGVQILGVIAACALIDPALLLAAVVVIPGTFLPVRAFSRRLRAVTREQLAVQARLGRRVEQMLQGHAVAQLFGAEPKEQRRLAEEGEGYLAVMRRSLLLRAAYTPTLEFLGAAALAFAIVYAGREATRGAMAPEATISFAVAALLLYRPLKALGNLGQLLAQLRGAAERAFEILDAPEAIRDEAGARELAAPEELRLEDVCVRYGDRVALDHVTLRLRRGETVALVGASGAGKSTIASLLMRFLDPDEGRVTFDGVDVRTASLRSLRAHVGYVPQETVVFAASARENIACGAELSGARVREAAEEACAAAWIERLPEGYETELGERGAGLSGGERQRLGIARALARGARVLLLDEATSALDAANDSLLQTAFSRALAGERIGLLITHRLLSTRGVDRVVVLEEGRVVEEGAPDELLRRGGRFAALWKLQAEPSAQVAQGA